MKDTPDWNDLRIFLAIARLGTISSTGERMGIEHTTVSRRMDRLEATLGLVLFDRRRSGYTLTEAGEALIPYAEKMETALHEAVDRSVMSEARIQGAVRVGTPEAFGINVLAPQLTELNTRYPDLQIQLMAQPQFPSLVTREVEILVTLEPPQVGRYTISKLATIKYYLYGSRSYIERNGPINNLADVKKHRFIDYIHDGSVSERYRILEELDPEPQRCFSTTSVLAQRAAAVAGLGLVLLTPYVAEQRPDLVCVFPDNALMTRGIWIAAPEDLLKIRRVRIVWDYIRQLIEADTRRFHRNSN